VAAFGDRGAARVAGTFQHHRDFLRFAIVGAITWVIDTAVFLSLKSTVLPSKPVTCKIIAVVIAISVSYLLSRSWSFRLRRALPDVHEGTRFLVVSGLGVAFYSAPLWMSRYLLDLRVPWVSPVTQEIADFVSGQIIGVLVGMAFRWWAFNRFVFPGARPCTTGAPSLRASGRYRASRVTGSGRRHLRLR